MSRANLTAMLLIAACVMSCTAHAENWPGWRGPRGDGTSIETQVPIRWDGASGENVTWKVEVPGIGHASPIVWQDRLFTVSCIAENLERVLLCFDRHTGRQLWQRTVVHSPLETKHGQNSHASSTPATDGELVFVTFLEVGQQTVPAKNVSKFRPVTPGQIVVAAYDFDGKSTLACPAWGVRQRARVLQQPGTL